MDLAPDRAALAVERHNYPNYDAPAGSACRTRGGKTAAMADDGLPLRPKPVRIRRPEDPLSPEEIDLRERLHAQPRPNAELR
ncbi:hypothetical protein K373_02703 [Streptomyces sp. DvalAA-21]|nr:hypothetical protein SACTE_3637 [Streptomyces sp. SirexAA-E]PZX40524.1 hypothetical protein K373_02703 [Streptomyces sp. DvalAA-21]RAJ36689.1 hypothetical protein K351_02448 [Streptomyces sp. DpondAA-E10]RAJ50656.1 hypothetical protein K352_01843 [Streptomyces sp. DpondAA-A50]SCE52052.1 hypothetical protein GA0115235_122741 [Streptomyces sp. DpondAA-F4a]SCM04617.1 hypothetical protein SAMN04883147_1066106 [Streptomyces sp. DpondAA-F4]